MLINTNMFSEDILLIRFQEDCVDAACEHNGVDTIRGWTSYVHWHKICCAGIQVCTHSNIETI